MAGIPADTSALPIDIAKNVLCALGLPTLSAHILSVRKLVRKQGNAANSTVGSRQNQPAVSTASFVVTLTSGTVRDAVLAKKREKRQLKRSEVFEDCTAATKDMNIYLNEMLPSSVYSLLLQAKKKASETAYRYVWVRGGNIYVRKADGQPRLNIRTPQDLAKLQ